VSLLIPTGAERKVTCKTCGTELVAYESETLDGRVLLIKERHAAPCGRPCISGGVPPRAYRAGEYHRADCAECGAKE
jgi:hypothetical protein